MTSLTFYGGINEIGGNQILLEDGDTRFLLDFGLSFTRSGEYFTEFVQPRLAVGIRDHLEFGLIPKLRGLYREDLLRPTELAYEEPGIDGVLLTHPHLDHVGCVSLIDPKIPIYCSSVAGRVLGAIEETSRGGFVSEYTKGKFRPFGTYLDHKKWQPFERTLAEPSDIGGVEVRAFEVDHSTLGACAYLLHTSDATVAYTGDLRLHGPKGELTRLFLEALERERVDALVIEGTRVEEREHEETVRRLTGESPKLASEVEVRERSLELLSKTRQPVFVEFPPRDFSRLKMFREIASEVGRQLVLPPKLAYYLQELGDVIGVKLEDMLIYIEPQGLGAYDEREYPRWAKPFVGADNSKCAEWLREHLSELVVYLDFFSLQNLIDLKPKGGLYINASSEPFSEEEMFDFERLKRWLEHFGLSYRYLHASGHLSREEVFDLTKRVKARKVIPVHTLGTELFRRELPNALVPELGKPIEIG